MVKFFLFSLVFHVSVICCLYFLVLGGPSMGLVPTETYESGYQVATGGNFTPPPKNVEMFSVFYAKTLEILQEPF